MWLVPLCGWLLEYPVLYISGGGGAGAGVGGNQLAGQPLVLWTASVGLASPAAEQHHWLRQHCASGGAAAAAAGRQANGRRGEADGRRGADERRGAGCTTAANAVFAAPLYAFSVPAALCDAAIRRVCVAGAGGTLSARLGPAAGVVGGLWVRPEAEAGAEVEAEAGQQVAGASAGGSAWLRARSVTLDQVAL